MKNISMIIVAVLVVAGFSSYAFADPGWGNGHRPDSRYQNEQPYHQPGHRDFRDHRDDRNYRVYRGGYTRPVVIHRVPVAPRVPVVRVYEPPVPAVRLYFPHVSISFR